MGLSCGVRKSEPELLNVCRKGNRPLCPQTTAAEAYEDADVATPSSDTSVVSEEQLARLQPKHKELLDLLAELES
jgi:hypothetical protein